MGGATANKAQTDRNMTMIEKVTVNDQGQWIFGWFREDSNFLILKQKGNQFFSPQLVLFLL